MHQVWRTEGGRFQAEGPLAVKATERGVFGAGGTALTQYRSFDFSLDSAAVHYCPFRMALSCSSQTCFQFMETRKCNFTFLTMSLVFSVLQNPCAQPGVFMRLSRGVQRWSVEWEVFTLLVDCVCCEAFVLPLPA